MVVFVEKRVQRYTEYTREQVFLRPNCVNSPKNRLIIRSFFVLLHAESTAPACRWLLDLFSLGGERKEATGGKSGQHMALHF